MFKHILVPVDGSETSMKAVAKASALAKTFDSAVTALYVIDPYPFTGVGADFAYGQAQYLSAATAEANAALDAAKAAINQAGVANVSTMVGEGHAVHDGIQRAIEKNSKKGRIVAGGSTISQQLAKNLFLTPSKSPWRKGQEAVVTLMIEAVWSKQRIFEVYLNVIEWGNGVFGAEAAARHHFGVSAAQLSPAQAARLASMVPSPRYYDRHPDSASLAFRSETLLGRMPSAQIP